jgi:hypothetical protein
MVMSEQKEFNADVFCHEFPPVKRSSLHLALFPAERTHDFNVLHQIPGSCSKLSTLN